MSGQCQGYGLMNILSKGQQGPLANKGIISDEGDKIAKMIKMQDKRRMQRIWSSVGSCSNNLRWEEPFSYSDQLFSLDSFLFILSGVLNMPYKTLHILAIFLRSTPKLLFLFLLSLATLAFYYVNKFNLFLAESHFYLLFPLYKIISPSLPPNPLCLFSHFCSFIFRDMNSFFRLRCP